MKRKINRFLILCIVFSPALFTGCRLFGPKEAGPENRAPGSVSSISFAEKRLLELIEQMQALKADAREATPDDTGIERRFQDLARAWQSYLADNPKHLEGHLIYGKLLAWFGDREGATVAFKDALKIDPNVAVAHQQIGNYFAEEGDPARALNFFLRAVELAPDVAEYHYSLGECLSYYRDKLVDDRIYTREAVDEAIMTAFREAADNAPDNLIIQFRYGEAAYDVETPDWDAMAEHWESLTDIPGLTEMQRDAIRLHRARAAVELGNRMEAESLLKEPVLPGLEATRQSLLEEL